MSISFSKMHGLGNDFVVINALSHSLTLSPAAINQLGNRHLGIGFDQLLMIEPSTQADFGCRIFNADGSEAEQCGNGLRCVGRYLRENNVTEKNIFTVATKAGIFTITIHAIDAIQVEMGKPRFNPAHVPFLADAPQLIYPLTLAEPAAEVSLSVLSMGNPHAILEVATTEDCAFHPMGSQIAAHHAFPNSTNVGFMEVIDRTHIRLRTFERGVGETFACGSNACAAAVAGIQRGLLDSKVRVLLTHGQLMVEWQGDGHSVFLTGPATRVFDGIIAL